MRYLTILATLFLTLVLSGSAEAQRRNRVDSNSTTLYWSAPTQYEDGSPLSFSDISSYTIYRGIEPGIYYSIGTAGRKANKFNVKNLSNGTHYFVITVTLRNGETSNYSNYVVRSFGAAIQPATSPADFTRGRLF